MKLNKWLFILLLATCGANAKQVKVAVIDTGIKNVPHMCKEGHKSFNDSHIRPTDDIVGHGTHIAGLIYLNAGSADFCMISLAYYDPEADGQDNLKHMKMALKYAVSQKVDIINISAGGPVPNEEEKSIIIDALNKGIKIVAAAGNENSNLDKDCNYFPACYDKRIVAVGNLLKPLSLARSPASNYGHYVKLWEVGTNARSFGIYGHMTTMTGTSQATAIATGKLLSKMR